jgi:D-inositol-3-phosphate glycosyltransferase
MISPGPGGSENNGHEDFKNTVKVEEAYEAVRTVTGRNLYIISLGPAHPYRGGIATFNDRLARQITAEGHRTEIVTFSLQYPKILFPGKTQFTDGPPPEGIVISRKLNSINPLSWMRTGLYIRKKRPDILLIRYWLPFMGPALGTVSRLAVSNHHTVAISIFDNVVPHEKRPGDKLLTGYFTGSIDGAIVMSGNVADDLAAFNPKIPVRLSPHPLFDNYGPSVSRYEALASLHMNEEYRYILFFGFIRAYKGLDLLIKAFADRRLRKKKIRLIIAGEFYEDSEPYNKLIEKYGLENEIIIHDHFIPDCKVPYYFCAADLVVQPYRSATQSGVTQIAYQYDKPMLVTQVGGLREIVKDKVSGYVVQPSPEEIAGAVNDFFENNRMDLFTEGVKREKHRFSWSSMTASVIDVYNQCVSGSGRSN